MLAHRPDGAARPGGHLRSAERPGDREHGDVEVRIEHAAPGATKRGGLPLVMRTVDDHDRVAGGCRPPVVCALGRPAIEALELSLREQLEARVECEAASRGRDPEEEPVGVMLVRKYLGARVTLQSAGDGLAGTGRVAIGKRLSGRAG